MTTFGRECLFTRSAVVAEVKPKQRLIELIAVPYEQEAEIAWRGEMWREVFSRSAFNGLQDHAGRVPVNREHDRLFQVGKVVRFDPQHPEGLFTRVQIARTERGDDTLALAEDDMVSASVGYYVKSPRDVQLDKRTMHRRVNRAFLEHLALVGDPAYDNARVLAVRSPEPDLRPPLPATPLLDTFLDDDVLRWARDRARPE